MHASWGQGFRYCTAEALKMKNQGAKDENDLKLSIEAFKKFQFLIINKDKFALILILF